ncbi:hypothetical protein D3C76_1467070 [compost metagenome]
MGVVLGGGGVEQVLFGLFGIGGHHLAFEVEPAQQQLGARLVGGTALVDVAHQLVHIAQVREVVQQLRQAHP